MTIVTLAATQMACTHSRDENIASAERLVRTAAQKGANIILLQELFETPYFCKEQEPDLMMGAQTVGENRAIRHMSALAKSLGVVLPVSFYERDNNARFNSAAIIDATGEILGIYRKSHIPDGPGYREKYYFTPGDTGFKVWPTRFGMLGLAICWDQWFPEAARILALKGADVICYPTAIGSEPHDPTINSREHWQRTMQGHAAANLVPVIASNRVGREEQRGLAITFYGSSFITDVFGAKVAEAPVSGEAVLTAAADFVANRQTRANWGIFRDRRPDLYGPLLTHDGKGAGRDG
ncbi:MAG: N-carbamoylputrescine amidase [Alphaproteobacteria bacterium]|nr:N-carbamoylputrescine amidase [Alphaproteobacteria bacterium]